MQEKLNNIVLIGPMGSGKTTVGRRLAEQLKIDFYDADHEIINKTGVSIDHIFDVEGEQGFRKRESDVLEELASMHNIVLATGGGAVLSERNRLLLKKSGSVIYLLSSVDQILRRTAKSKTRPLLENSSDRRKTISDIIDSRDSLYREIATFIINTNGKKLNEIIKGLGGTTVGRPYLSGGFHVTNNTIAFTYGLPNRPANIAVVNEGQAKVLTALNEDLLEHKKLGLVNEIVYNSSFDDQEIQGWYITPPDFDPSKKYPLILEIHGGPHLAYGPNFSAEMQIMAAAGYVVFYDNYRGSLSYGEDFALLLQYKYSSSEDFADHMSGIDAMIDLGFIDDENLFIAGGSAGGIATAYAVGLTDRFNAAVAAKPVINWLSKPLTADSMVSQIYHQFPGPPWEHLEHYWKRSPLSLMGNVTTPTMLLTGEDDRRTPISETEQFYQALRLQGVDSAMVRLPDTSHGIAGRPSRLISKVDHILAWFERYRTDKIQN